MLKEWGVMDEQGNIIPDAVSPKQPEKEEELEKA